MRVPRYNPRMTSAKDSFSQSGQNSSIKHDSGQSLRNTLDEAQNSEAKLRWLIDTIPAVAWYGLPDGSKQFLNKRWHDYTGILPEESYGWGWQAVVHPEDLSPLMTKWSELRTSEKPGEIEARVRRHDGVYRWFLIRAGNRFATKWATWSAGME
jgi:PAS domain S-box-containing protein